MNKRVEPGPGEESVWDYPRPPRIEPVEKRVLVMFNDHCLADSTSALRVLETASPPTIYIPRAEIDTDCLKPAVGRTYCEWKGFASYLHAVVEDRTVRKAAWFYPDPKAAFHRLRDHISFYAGRVDACYIGDELVAPQGGRYYGGWVTKNIVGPYKGEPGSEGW
ncbi:MAG: DUF427 domain-containing protein [Actinomycetota bacterium]|nr:DUF427 domain-containing protein [Actinomycetota bacterium]